MFFTDTIKNPKLCENIVIRKEWFGGLVFKKSDMSVFQVNDATFHVLELIINNFSFDDLLHTIQKNYQLEKKDLQKLLKVLNANKVIK